MICFCEFPLPKFNTSAIALCALVLIGLVLPLQAQQPDDPAFATALSAASGRWQSGEAVHLIGLPEIREKEKGSLSISADALTFTSPYGRASVPRAKILNVSVGDVTLETGGTAGKITRAIIPFGGGSAVATVSHKNSGILTIEFRDQRGALHGAVFLLSKDEASQAQQQLGVPTSPHPMESLHGQCETNGVATPDTIKVGSIMTLGAPVPTEYKVLIYEQLLRQLRDAKRFTAIYRDGDEGPEAACPKYNLVLTLEAFNKGNAAVRASTGPVGFFVGATKLTFHLQVQGINGRIILDKELQASKRGDTDSLGIADTIAKKLTKELRKDGMRTAQS